MNEKQGLFRSLVLVGIFLIELSNGATTVDYITPNAGSSNGGTRITIHGKEFAKTQFNYGAGNEHLGNFVELVSGTYVYVCDIHTDGCTNITVTCNTRPMPNGEYNIRLKVDGIAVPDSNYNVERTKFTVRPWNTPTISSITPTSGVPGTLVTVCGRIISTRFGSNIPESDNGLPNKLLRIYHNGQVCEVKDVANDVFYGIWLDNPETLNGKGCFKCKMSGTYVANQNFSFIVEGEFGRSKPDLSVLALNADGKISMFQTYAVIKSVSPSSGSVEGGTVLTITGENFDQTDAPATVTVGGVECAVTSVSNTEIKCTTPVKPAVQPSYTGNRGLLREEWRQTPQTFADRANILTLSTTAADYASSIIDTASFSEDLYPNSVKKLSGYLVPSMTANYRFYIRCDDYAALSFSETGPPSGLAEVATCSSFASTYWRRSEQTSREFALTAGTAYYMEVVQGNNLNTSSVNIALRSNKSPVTGSMSGDGLDEIQEIMVNSTVTSEEQVLTLSGLDAAATAYTSEKQTISVTEITGGNVDATYRLGLYGVYTAPIPATADSTTVAKALNELASYAPDTVSVTQTSPSATSETFVVTFLTGRGNLPLLTTMVEPKSSSLSVSVSGNKDGVASKDKAYLQIDKVISPGIVAGATKDDVQAALNSLFGVRCPPVIASPAAGTSAYLQDFEGSASGMGEITMEVEPLCGRKSVKNPNYIYKTPDKQLGVKIGDFRTLCFGYQGAVKQLKVQHDYKDAGQRWYQWFDLDLAPTADNTWNYTCMDIGTTIVNKNADKTLHRVWRIEITRESEENDVFIDTVAMLIPDKASSDLGEGINLQRYRSAKPGGYPMKEISVTGTGPFTVTMSPFDCGNGFDLFKVADSQTTVSVGASRTTAASPPVTGSFNIQFGSRSLTIPVTSTITDSDVQVLIENEFSDIMGSVSVVHQGDCANFAYTVTFITNRGDQEEMTIPTSNLRGNSPVASIKTTRNGGAFFDPIPGDMLRTASNKPQVVAMINKVPTACDGTCSFDWETSSTPTVTATSPATGTQALSTVLTIDGTGFSAVKADNSVKIGGVACVVATATTNQITCNVGNGPMGQYDVVVNIEGKGQAAGTFQFTYTASADSISPSTGSFGGGTVTTISGSGFASNAVVQVDGVNATVIESQPGQITFYTPKYAAATTQAVSVTVQQYGNTLTVPTQFTYDQSLTPTITSTSITETSVFGGDSITITGSGFGGSASSPDALKINGAAATITSYSDTQVVATLPANPPGTYTVDLTIGSKGYAFAATGGTLTYRLKVTKMSPVRGSIYGGTLVTIEGQGFGTDSSKVQAAFGTFGCTIKTITDTQIVCLTSSSAATLDVSNQGTHISYGKGFEWSPRSLSAQVGDTISWTWSTQSTGYQFGVYESPNITAKENKKGGFLSGDQSPSGSFKLVLSSPGTYTYWSGFVDGIAQAISLHGSITVTDRADTITNLVLKAGGYEAEYDVTNKGSTIAASGACPGDTSSISPCSSLTGDADKFNFAYQDCMTPTWQSVSHNQATGTQTIDLMGSGFASTNCQNEVKLGDYDCVVSSSTAFKITCSVDTQSTMEVGSLEFYDLRIGNRGYPMSGIQTKREKSFVLLPHVASLSPLKGSVEGGLTLTIQGGGFVSQGTTVMIESFDCPVLSVDYSTVTCELPRSGKDGFKTVTVSVTSNGQTGNAVCTSRAGCAFQYDAASTAAVTSVSPDTISGPTTLTITGTQFGTSGVTVSVGGETCTVSSATDTQIVCAIASAPVGSRDVDVFVSGIGKAFPTVKVSSADALTSITPSSGSTEGGTNVVINGNGFVFNKTSVTIGGQDCEVTGSTLTSIECVTPAGTAGGQVVTVISDGTTYTSTLTFTYDTAKTPTVTSVSPTSGKAGDSITISGTSFSGTSSDNVVTLGGSTCTVTSATSTSIACTLGTKSPGQYDVEVSVATFGNAQSSATFSYTVSATSINPSTGSLGGGQAVTISGSGFDAATTSATVCGEECVVDGATSSSTQLICSTPASTGTTTQSCDVVVSDNGQTSSLTGAYTYDAAASPSVTSVAPSVGSTSGGTTLTITGSGFGNTQGAVTVTIGGVSCTIQSVTDTQVVCQTGARTAGSVDAQVQLQVNGGGNARQIGAAFSYMYAWSSPNSWNGNPPPAEGELVVIPKGMTILLDQTTPVLKMLVIQGGKVVFDEKDITLNAEYILITSGGALQVGTEQQPFQSQATIKLHGFYRSDQLPVYGSKVLAVREGTLDLHGIPTPVTWTMLQSTATAGATTLTLQQAVDWPVGSEIVIATTGHRHSQIENEKRKITAVSPDGLTLTLDSALTYEHVAVTETYGSKTVELRAEVGLLSHNVKVMGSSDDQWADKIEACPDGFDTGEFVTQTCFQGRFGDEVGSDQFGSQILIHAPRPNENLVQARIEYVEVTHAGQAFRLGRYPIHFHLNGDMSTSYVRGCGIHRTFNRAVNVHGTHNLMIERTVIYNIMGGAFFLEDGIETGNTFQYNLAVFVIASTSLLNDDITPASFWVTNPNNTIQHNHAAGGTHFGFWYRMHEHPDGPSFDPNICPQRVPLGVFQNNTAHSFGWFGIWIFQTYAPRQNGACDSTAPYETAIFRSLTAWNCEKGGEVVDGGAVQFVDMVFINNEKAGYEGKLIIETPAYDPATSYALKDSILVGRSPNLAKAPKGWDTGNGCTIAGVVIPYGNGGVFSGLSFYNFNEVQCQAFTFTKIDGTCSDKCGAFTYHLSGMTFDTESAKRKLKFEWFHHGALVDLDGSFTGQSAGSSVVPTMSHLPPSCTAAGSEFNMMTSASICQPGVKFIRMSFNNIVPDDLKGNDAMITTQYGTQRAYYAFKRITHPNGWAALLPEGEEFQLQFENANQVTNISYSVKYYGLTDLTDHVVACQALDNKPDRFYFATTGGTGVNVSATALDIGTNKHGDWTFNNVTNQMCYMVAGKLSRKRSTAGLKAQEGDRAMEVKSYKCYFTDCIPPPDPDTIPPVCTTPATAVQWSAANWTVDAEGYVTNVKPGTGTRAGPMAGEKVKIAKDTWVVADSAFPAMEALVLEGVLEIDDGPTNDREFTIDLTYMYIFGGKLMAGCPGDPFQGKLNIILRGSHATPVWPRTEGPNIGSKVIAVFGGLDLHGIDVGRTWTRLQQTVAAGSNQIVLAEDVTWSVGDEIVIAATSYNAHESEVMTIQAIAADKRTITLTSSLTNRHTAASESFANGKSYTIGAEVGLLTRNIKIIGAEYTGIETESFGARVLVGVTSTIERSYTGYGRLSNVEFVRGGQEGFTESYDPRFALAFLDAGQVTNIKPSSVSKCSFHHGYNPAIGVFGVHGIEISENVIYKTVGSAIETKSVGTRLIRNLGLYSLWRGTYNGRYEPNNFVYQGVVDAIGSRELVMQHNAFAASERALYHGPPEDCASKADPWIDNTLHSGMMGTLIMPSDSNEAGFNSADRCVQYANFTIWKCWDYGLYYNSINDVELYHNTLIENGVGIFLFIYGPDSLEHQFRDHYMKIEDALVVGETSEFDCTADFIDVNADKNYFCAIKARSWRINKKGKIGVSTPNFGAGSNAASDKPFANMMTYQALGGRMTLTDVTFANFKSTCDTDYAITSNPINDDAMHGMMMSGTALYNVDNKLYIHRPLVGMINPSDCVDMECDGHKKILIKDLDGSFLGKQGDAFSKSELAWDVSTERERGIGDYRIPKQMVTYPDGTRQPYEVVAKYKGIIRDSTCDYWDTSRAYVCDRYNYEQVVIESMDADTETRRLSPVALLGWDDDGNGYMDLINGPQDQGWCAGYTCQLRLSTFLSIMATGRNYSVYFTSVSPQHLRYRMLNVDDTKSVGIATYYNTPNRLDVYCDGVYVLPNNGRKDSEGRVLLEAATTYGQFIPDPVTGACGENYLDYDWKHQHVIVRGTHVVDIKTVPVIVLGFNVPSMTVDQFFGDKLVDNLALFLNIPASKIRVMSVVSGVDRRRKKRSTGDNTMFTVEIGNQPCSDLNCTTPTVGTLTFTSLQELAVVLINSYQAGNLSDILNITINSMSCAEPIPPVTDPSWADVTAAGDNYLDVLKVPQTMTIEQDADGGPEGKPFTIQPRINMLDVLGAMISKLGASTAPWQVSVTLKAGSGSNPLAQLTGTTNITFVNGWANFSDIGISHEGSGYVLEFTLSYPTEVIFKVESGPLTVVLRPLKAGLVSKTGDVFQNSLVTVALDIRDSESDTRVSDINWKGHLWKVTASMSSPSSFNYDGVLAGTTTGTFDPATGEVTLNDIRFDKTGFAVIKFLVESNPPGYSFELQEFVEVIAPEYSTITEDTTSEMTLKVDLDYDTYGKADFGAAVVNSFLQSEYTRKKDMKMRAGSVYITVTISGNTTTVQQVIDDTCNSISAGGSFTYNGQTYVLSSYMTINNQTYYGVNCGEKDEDEMKLAMIIALVICCLIIFALACGILYWRCVVYPKTKTHKLKHFNIMAIRHGKSTKCYVQPYHKGQMKDPMYLGQCNGKNPEEILWRENTFQSLREKSWLPESFVPPTQTTFMEKKQNAFTGHA